jgi:hypothetical protein
LINSPKITPIPTNHAKLLNGASLALSCKKTYTQLYATLEAKYPNVRTFSVSLGTPVAFAA